MAGTILRHSALPLVALKTGGEMYSRAERYRRRGIEAQQRAAQAAEPSIKRAFEDVASDWFALAEQVDWLEGFRRPGPSTPEGKSK